VPSAPPATEAGAEQNSGNLDGRAGAKKPATRATLTPGERAYEQTRDASFLEPVSWAVTAYKSRHQIVVHYKGHLYRIYRAVFGRSQEHGSKEFEGDRRTPEGVYTIIDKHPSRRWRWFLTLNYPNVIDRRRYDDLRSTNTIPVEDGEMIGPGGHVGIHGTDTPILNRGEVNWTLGCISVDNRDIDELNRLLPLGTIVIIRP